MICYHDVLCIARLASDDTRCAVSLAQRETTRQPAMHRTGAAGPERGELPALDREHDAERGTTVPSVPQQPAGLGLDGLTVRGHA